MAGSQLQLSVALVTRNRPESLARTIASLRAQSVQPWEVVISDDSDERFAPDVQRIAEKWACRYVSGPQRGLYANRNHAALACHGTHVRTMDDDHEFPPGHIACCIAAIVADPDSVWVIGEFLADQEIEGGAVPFPGQLHPRGYSVAPPDPQCCWAIAERYSQKVGK
jgi:glycosyltransferase involved in cell wall biosynthesis